MDKINFAHTRTPYTELQLARWYTVSCILILLMLIGMCGIYATQWRAYQRALHLQQSSTAQQALEQEHAQLQTQHATHLQLTSSKKITAQQLAALNESLAHDITLNECVIARDGNHNLTITAPSRQRAQECATLLNKKQLFGTLTMSSLKAVKSGEKTHLLVTLKGQPTQNPA